MRFSTARRHPSPSRISHTSPGTLQGLALPRVPGCILEYTRFDYMECERSMTLLRQVLLSRCMPDSQKSTGRYAMWKRQGPNTRRMMLPTFPIISSRTTDRDGCPQRLQKCITPEQEIQSIKINT